MDNQWEFAVWLRELKPGLCSISKSCPTLCKPIDNSTPGFPLTISGSLLKLMSIELVMPSNYFILCRPLLLLPSIFPSIRVFSNEKIYSYGQKLLVKVGTSASASVLPVNIQGWFPVRLTGSISLQSKALSRVFSSNAIWKHQFFCAQPSLWSNSHICTWLLEKP